jgi:hypothetical protein
VLSTIKIDNIARDYVQARIKSLSKITNHFYTDDSEDQQHSINILEKERKIKQARKESEEFNKFLKEEKKEEPVFKNLDIAKVQHFLYEFNLSLETNIRIGVHENITKVIYLHHF